MRIIRDLSICEQLKCLHGILDRCEFQNGHIAFALLDVSLTRRQDCNFDKYLLQFEADVAGQVFFFDERIDTVDFYYPSCFSGYDGGKDSALGRVYRCDLGTVVPFDVHLQCAVILAAVFSNSRTVLDERRCLAGEDEYL